MRLKRHVLAAPLFLQRPSRHPRIHNQNHGESQGQLASRAISAFRHAPGLGAQGGRGQLSGWNTHIPLVSLCPRPSAIPVDSISSGTASRILPAPETDTSIFGALRDFDPGTLQVLSNPEERRQKCAPKARMPRE
ncbi:hypothetical protein LZ32DRAFT_221402 [Colletotrichum eremochloae]|nr:hypothetical protein LZ32DRAFT_221402 [Colletotrichum eremochloae]